MKSPINSPSERVIKSKTSLLQLLQGTGDGKQLHTAAVQVSPKLGFCITLINSFDYRLANPQKQFNLQNNTTTWPRVSSHEFLM